ncbi:TPA: hypothetical protein ACXE8V_001611 [Pluralibacter gergoviae]
MGEYQMIINYGFKTPEQWKQESTLALLFHYDHVETCFMADEMQDSSDWNSAEEYMENLIMWIAEHREATETRRAIESYSKSGSEEQTEFFLGAILGDEY